MHHLLNNANVDIVIIIPTFRINAREVNRHLLMIDWELVQVLVY